MLTPDKIRERVFQTTGRGSYRSDDVDMFMSEVIASFEQMYKENGDLVRKISILAKKVEEYRADEESLKMALLNAQKLADRIVAEAKETAANEVASVKDVTDKLRADAVSDAQALETNAKNESEEMIANAKAEAAKILEDANREASDILGNINRKVTHESLVYEMIQKEASEFKSKLIAMYREHITLINDLPEIVDEQLDKQEETVAEETVEEVVEETVEEFVPEVAYEEVVMEEVEEEAPVEDETPTVEEVAVVEEPVLEDAPVVEEEPAVVEDVADFVVDEVETVEETPAFDEAYSEPISDEIFKNFEDDSEKTVVVEKKKSFKLDLSQIDFADENDYVAPAPHAQTAFENYGVIEDIDSGADDSQPMSFKGFFKKK